VVLMGLSTFYTQRQMIARSGTTDPQQVMVQKLLLYVLPLSFAVSGAIFPIGVLLYWLTTNLWSMGQQAYVIKRMPPVNLNPGATGTKSSGTADSKTKPAKGDAAKGDAVKGDAVKGDAVKGDAVKGDAVKGDAATGEAAGSGSAAPGTTTPSVPSSGGSRVSATPPAPVAAPANRRPAGSRKNKNRRGGRR
jgi:YidC/Oxa1 family membrane protein insertase